MTKPFAAGHAARVSRCRPAVRSRLAAEAKGSSATRREVAACVTLGLLGSQFAGDAALASNQVGSYLPAAGVNDFVLFVPDKSKTPAIRAGTVDRTSPYRFALPPSWSERKVANIASGNYCQPRCAEPWTEVIFADDSEGKVQVLAAPLVRLTNKKDATIQEVGDLDGVLMSLGPFITGTYLDLDDVLDSKAVKREDGLTYYYYDIYATYGLNGPHTLTACTVKGDLALLLSAQATDKQFTRSKGKLKAMVDSFRA